MDIFQIIWRSMVLIMLLFAVTKLTGKRQIAQLSFFEYVTGITIGSIAGEMSTGLEKSFWHGATAISIWGIMPLLAGIATLKSRKLREWIEGRPTVIIQNGHILEQNLAKEKYTTDELLELLRTKGIFQLSDVEYALIETNGTLNALLKKGKRPVTYDGDETEKEPYVVILEGNIQFEALTAAKQTPSWLQTELQKQKVKIDQVFIAQGDSEGNLTIDLYKN
jgi:uncharacterized membrane protein YcaP (DUF421 family)